MWLSSGTHLNDYSFMICQQKVTVCICWLIKWLFFFTVFPPSMPVEDFFGSADGLEGNVSTACVKQLVNICQRAKTTAAGKGSAGHRGLSLIHSWLYLGVSETGRRLNPGWTNWLSVSSTNKSTASVSASPPPPSSLHISPPTPTSVCQDFQVWFCSLVLVSLFSSCLNM